MPEIKAEVTVTSEIEFEMYCTCGAGICGNAEVRYSRSRNYPQVVVKPCESCMQARYDEGLADGSHDVLED